MLPAGAAVTLAHALGRWREASSVSAVRSVAKREKDQLTALLREQADACDAEVNALTAEIEDLMEALAGVGVGELEAQVEVVGSRGCAGREVRRLQARGEPAAWGQGERARVAAVERGGSHRRRGEGL